MLVVILYAIIPSNDVHGYFTATQESTRIKFSGQKLHNLLFLCSNVLDNPTFLGEARTRLPYRNLHTYTDKIRF